MGARQRESTPEDEATPIAVHLLGRFRVVKHGRVLNIGDSPKSQALIVSLAIRPNYSASRDTLLSMIWPDRERELSGQSLNSLISSLRRVLGDVIGGEAPVLHDNGYYRINVEAGISLDTRTFDELARAGDQAARGGSTEHAISSYTKALDLYEGDLCSSQDIQCLLERERLRAVYLTVASQIADYHFKRGDYRMGLEFGQRLLWHDPCREDAHRLLMRCYVRLGERAQALRQFRLCEDVLREEFDAPPEGSTRALFDAVRLDPTSV
jgi:DNA-binding SARP family transcriptional activator